MRTATAVWKIPELGIDNNVAKVRCLCHRVTHIVCATSTKKSSVKGYLSAV